MAIRPSNTQGDGLLDQANGGDEKALGDLCAGLETHLLAYARRRLGGGPASGFINETADIVHQVLLEFLDEDYRVDREHGYERLLDALEFRVFARIVNLRRSMNNSPALRVVDDLVHRYDPLDGSQGPVTWEDTRRWLHALIDRLPEIYGDVLRLRVKEGQDWDRIAAELGCSVHTARKRYQRAVVKLADKAEVKTT